MTMAREDPRRRFLEEAYEDTGGVVDNVVSILRIGTRLGLDHAQAMSVASYWWQKGCTRPGGGLLKADGIRMTATGVDLVEEWMDQDRSVNGEHGGKKDTSVVFQGPVYGVQVGDANTQYVGHGGLAALREELDRLLAHPAAHQAADGDVVEALRHAAALRDGIVVGTSAEALAPRARLLQAALVGLGTSVAGSMFVEHFSRVEELVRSVWPG